MQNFLQELQQAGIAAEENPALQFALHIINPVGIELLPGFNEGSCSVQDFGAQYAALLLAPEPGERILDACAAPGGKTGHLMELCPDIAHLLAVDNSPDRCQLIEKTMPEADPEACVGDEARAVAAYVFHEFY